MLETKPKKFEEQEAGDTHIFRKSIFALCIRLILLFILWTLVFLTFSWLFYLFRNSISVNVFMSINLLFIFLLQLLFALTFLYLTMTWLGEIFIISPPNIVIRKGVLRVQEIEMKIPLVENYKVEQGLLGKLFNYGTIKLEENLELVDVPDPHHIAQVFLEHTQKESQI